MLKILIINFEKWIWFHWLIISFLFIITIFLIFLQTIIFYKRYEHQRAAKLINNFEIIKHLPLRLYLNRFSELARFNNEFLSVLTWYEYQYQLLINKEYQQLLDKATKFFSLKEQKAYQKSKELFKEVSSDVANLEDKLRKMLVEVSEILMVEQMQRQYVFECKDMFNDFRNEFIKLQINFSLRQETLNSVDDAMSNLLIEFEKQLNCGHFLLSYKSLDQITTGLVVMSEILERVPLLFIVIIKIINPNFRKLIIEYENNQNQKDNSNEIVLTKIDDKIKESLLLINNLQYKKAQSLVTEIWNELNEFKNNLLRNNEMKNVYEHYYESVMVAVEKIEKGFEQANKQLEDIVINYGLNASENDFINLESKLVKNLLYSTSQFIVEADKSDAKTNYINLVNKQINIVEQTLKAYEGLEKINKIIKTKTKTELTIKKLLSHLNVMVMQLNAKTNQLPYSRICYYYQNNIEDFTNNFSKIRNEIENNKDDNKNARLNQLIEFKSNLYKLYEKIKNGVIIDQLAQSVIIYGRKFGAIDRDVFNYIKTSQINYNQNNYELSLQIGIHALEEARVKKLFKKIRK